MNMEKTATEMHRTGWLVDSGVEPFSSNTGISNVYGTVEKSSKEECQAYKKHVESSSEAVMRPDAEMFYCASPAI